MMDRLGPRAIVGAVRNRLRVPETPEGGLPALAFGGGIAAATLVLVANTATMAGAFRAEEDGQIVILQPPRH